MMNNQKAPTSLNQSMKPIISLSTFSVEEPSLAHGFRICFLTMIVIINIVIIIGHIYFGRYFGDSDILSPKREISLMSGFLNYARENSGILPINDIRLTRTQCPTSYSEERLGGYKLNKACVGVGFFSTNDSLSSSCPEGATHPLDELTVEFKKWKGLKFCSTRTSSLKTINPEQKCPTNFKNCSQTLCVPTKEKCPLTMISIIDNEGAEETVKLGGFTLYLHRTYENNTTPLGKVFITNHIEDCRCNNMVPTCEEEDKPFKQEGKFSVQNCGSYGTEVKKTEIDAALAKDVFSWNADLDEIGQSQPLFISHLEGRGEFTLASLPLKYNSCSGESFDLIDKFIYNASEIHWYFHLYFQITVNLVLFALLIVTIIPLYLFIVAKKVSIRKNFLAISVFNLLVHVGLISGGFILLVNYLPQIKDNAQALSNELGNCYQDDDINGLIKDIFGNNNSEATMEKLGSLRNFAVYMIIVSFTGFAVDLFGGLLLRRQA